MNFHSMNCTKHEIKICHKYLKYLVTSIWMKIEGMKLILNWQKLSVIIDALKKKFHDTPLEWHKGVSGSSIDSQTTP